MDHQITLPLQAPQYPLFLYTPYRRHSLEFLFHISHRFPSSPSTSGLQLLFLSLFLLNLHLKQILSLMEKTERETHDFMNVESFSQLPFIRPAPVKEKGIRLFGKEVGADSTATDESISVETNACEGVKGNDNGESSRKFECHYCCRNFPTSQALGGHQNAHKRERQHAKRAHLQSAMVHGSFSEAHAYGFVNYRLGSAPTPTMTYQSWSHHTGNNAYTTNNRFYGSSHGSLSQPPINGSPLGLWRIPPVHSPTYRRDYSVNPVSLFTADELKPSITGSTSQNRFGYESKQASMQDHVSLDLRL